MAGNDTEMRYLSHSSNAEGGAVFKSSPSHLILEIKHNLGFAAELVLWCWLQNCQFLGFNGQENEGCISCFNTSGSDRGKMLMVPVGKERKQPAVKKIWIGTFNFQVCCAILGKFINKKAGIKAFCMNSSRKTVACMSRVGYLLCRMREQRKGARREQKAVRNTKPETMLWKMNEIVSPMAQWLLLLASVVGLCFPSRLIYFIIAQYTKETVLIGKRACMEIERSCKQKYAKTH